MSNSIPEEVRWGNSIERVSWRVETINASSREGSNAKNNDVVCLFEVDAKSNVEATSGGGEALGTVARFEVDHGEMKSLLGNLRQIDMKLSELSNTG